MGPSPARQARAARAARAEGRGRRLGGVGSSGIAMVEDARVIPALAGYSSAGYSCLPSETRLVQEAAVREEDARPRGRVQPPERRAQRSEVPPFRLLHRAAMHVN